MDKTPEQFFAALASGPMGREEYEALRDNVRPSLAKLGRLIPAPGVPFVTLLEFVEGEEKRQPKRRAKRVR